MPKKSKVTITDIARRVNMTTITVSRALNKPELVKKETLDRILEVARELNYVPNAFARNLKGSKSRLIGIITASMDNPFYSEMIKAISRAAKKRNYSIMLFDTDGSPELENKAMETMLSYQVDGIILSVVSDYDEYRPQYLEQLIHANIPVVQVDRRLPSAPFPGVYLDNLASGYKGGRYVLEQGHRHILALAGPEQSNISKLRLEGLKKALAECKEPTRLEVLYGDYTMQPAFENATAYFKQHEQAPDAVFGLNILITLGALKALRRLDNKNHNPAVFSIDEAPYADIFDFNIPCVHHDTYQMGHSAISMLLDRIENPGCEGSDIIIEGDLRAPV
ncbi:LacI family DNA-binding transcriptional regulator [Hahella sp. NBU794]|uniref:LacI family DNA-binding transcriptional regulator n=1 Tax=Hahella sp. NBU794 TaxID=3422590 RepID=UPI003D6E63FD